MLEEPQHMRRELHKRLEGPSILGEKALKKRLDAKIVVKPLEPSRHCLAQEEQRPPLAVPIGFS